MLLQQRSLSLWEFPKFWNLAAGIFSYLATKALVRMSVPVHQRCWMRKKAGRKLYGLCALQEILIQLSEVHLWAWYPVCNNTFSSYFNVLCVWEAFSVWHLLEAIFLYTSNILLLIHIMWRKPLLTAAKAFTEQKVIPFIVQIKMTTSKKYIFEFLK